MWVGASSAKPGVATVDVVTIREAEIQVDRDSVQVHPRVRAPETEQLCVMH
jgi:hypothetical protein